MALTDLRNNLIDPIAVEQAARSSFQNLNAGNNTLPNWLVNKEIFKSSLNTPIYDYVQFSLSDKIKTQIFVNCLISANKSINVSSTSIPGRNNNVMQFIDKGYWDITFNMKLIPTNLINIENTETNGFVDERLVGKPAAATAVGETIRTITSLRPIDRYLSKQSDITHNTDYYPDYELSELMLFFDKFFDNQEYPNIKVFSKFLNSNLGVYNIIPYAINTGQNDEFTNQYNIVISCYSDNNITDNKEDRFYSEIIPK